MLYFCIIILLTDYSAYIYTGKCETSATGRPPNTGRYDPVPTGAHVPVQPERFHGDYISQTPTRPAPAIPTAILWLLV